MAMRYAHLAPDHKLAAVERMAIAFPELRTDTKLTPAFEVKKSRTEANAIKLGIAYSYGRGARSSAG